MLTLGDNTWFSLAKRGECQSAGSDAESAGRAVISLDIGLLTIRVSKG